MKAVEITEKVNNKQKLEYKEIEYIPIEYPSTLEIMTRLNELEMEISAGLDELAEMLEE